MTDPVYELDLELRSFQDSIFDSKEDYVGRVLDEKPVIRSLAQFDAEYRALESNIEILEELYEDSIDTAVYPEDATLDEEMLEIPENWTIDNPVTDGAQSTFEYLEERREEGVISDYINEDYTLDTTTLLRDIKNLREDGNYNEFLEILYDRVATANSLNNAVREGIRRQGQASETSPEPHETDPFNAEDFERFLNSYIERHEDAADARRDIREEINERERIQRISNNIDSAENHVESASDKLDNL